MTTIATAPAAPTTTVAAARIERGFKIYGEGDIEVRALDNVTEGFAQSAFTAMMGPSGSGKSTLASAVALAANGVASSISDVSWFAVIGSNQGDQHEHSTRNKKANHRDPPRPWSQLRTPAPGHVCGGFSHGINHPSQPVMGGPEGAHGSDLRERNVGFALTTNG